MDSSEISYIRRVFYNERIDNFMKANPNRNQKKKGIDDKNYYVIVRNYVKNGKPIAEDLEKFNTEQQAESKIDYYRKLYGLIDIYRYVNGKFDIDYYNPKTTGLTAETDPTQLLKSCTEENAPEIHIITDEIECGEIGIHSGLYYDIKDEPEKMEIIRNCLDRYVSHDFGDLPQEDKDMNENALINGGRLLARYNLSFGDIYIITESDHKNTTILYCKDY